MSKRKYTHMKQYEAIIAAMRDDGKSRQEIADELGCEMKQVKWCIARYQKEKGMCDTSRAKAQGTTTKRWSTTPARYPEGISTT